jgi:hypothetical protein
MELMSNENKNSTIHLVIRNESFELSSSLFHQLLEYSSSLDFTISGPDRQHQIYLNVDPCIFNAYLLYIQSGCFIRPDHTSQEDLIHGLRLCGAPIALINHYERCDLMSALSSHQYSCHPINKNKRIQQIWLNTFILTILFISTCILTIDLYRQMLIFNRNPYQQTSKILIIIIYAIDSLLFLYSSAHSISKFISNSTEGKRSNNDPDFLTDIISCLGK